MNTVIFYFTFVLVIWFCADDKDVVKILLRAQKMGMTNGDFVFLYYTRNPLDEGVNLRVWEIDTPDNRSANEWELRRQAFFPLKMVTWRMAPVPSNEIVWNAKAYINWNISLQNGYFE